METSDKIIGIDLGTTNSVAAVVEGHEPFVIPNQEGSNKTPSVIAFLDNNECIVGEVALRQAATNSNRTISSVKRLIGASVEDLEEHQARFPFEIVEHDGHLLVDVDGMGYSPEQISALVLRKMKESAEAYLGAEVSQAVITVPAHFNDHQRNATIDSAKLAGLEVLRLLNEPTAAALAYGLGKKADSDEIVAVYDFGGGTFDITLLEISGKAFEVLTSTGDTYLGGDDLDNALVDLIVDEFQEEHGVDLAENMVTLRRLKEVAEKAKCELSTATQTVITLPFIAYKNSQPLHLERHLSRDEFEGLIEPFVDRTIRCCKRALEDIKMSRGDITKVIMVGGSTRIPMVQDLVEEFFDIQPFKGINPDEVVAMGAAVQAGIFTGNIEEVVLIDVAPHTLGIEVKDGKFSRIIEKNSPIPHKAAKNFTTTEDNQTFVVVHVLQGESEESTENQSLGKFMLTDIPPQPKGRPRIRVTFFMNADGVMEISAEDLGSGIAKSLTIVHTDLDESEKNVRRRARRRKVRRGDKPTQRRYSAIDAGRATNLSGRRRSDDSSVVQERSGNIQEEPKEEQSPSQDFAVLGDTNPGVQSNATPIPRKPSNQAIPLHHEEEAAARPQKLQPKAKPQEPVKPQPASQEIPPDESSQPEDYFDFKSEPETAAEMDHQSSAAEKFLESDSDSPEFSDESSEQGTLAYQDMEPEQVTGMLDPPEPTIEITDDPSTDGHHHLDYEEVDLPAEVSEALAKAENATDNGLAGTGAFDRAIDMLSQPPWSDDHSFPVRIAHAKLLLAAGRKGEFGDVMQLLMAQFLSKYPEELQAVADKAVAQLGAPEVFSRFRSKIRERLGDLEGACEDLELAVKADPKEGDREALEELYRARIDRGTDPAAQFKLVRLFLKTNRVDEATEILQDLVHNDAYETRALKILGLCHWQKNLHFLAWQKFKQLRQTDEIREILYRLGTDMESTGQLQNALSVYEHILRESPDYRDVPQKIKKLRYRVKIQQSESESPASDILHDSRFEILEEINRGSMGIIYRAQDKTLDEIVALKVLNDYLCTDPSAVERFKREARAARKLAHPFIVRIHDMFESGNKRFISMEYIEGTDFKRMLAEHTRFNYDELLTYFSEICDALSYAHKLNIIHRDIKPANIMITGANSIKITDFGIAKILKGDDSTKSGTAVIGTPLYMAPEQITGEGVDARTDIYAFGIMMYELVSGQPPFYLGNIEYHHIHTPPPPLPESVPEALRDIIMKCVEKNRENRYQSIDDLNRDIMAMRG